MCFCFCLLFAVSLGFKSFQRKIPNGDSVPHPCKPNYLWHGVGHENELGGGSRNPFGRDFDAAGKVRELLNVNHFNAKYQPMHWDIFPVTKTSLFLLTTDCLDIYADIFNDTFEWNWTKEKSVGRCGICNI